MSKILLAVRLGRGYEECHERGEEVIEGERYEKRFVEESKGRRGLNCGVGGWYGVMRVMGSAGEREYNRSNVFTSKDVYI